ncbi:MULTISPECIES: hypothetical protein [unclassified Pseudomonas]|uniref:hypothetical protein n=1 Tax=unclassified Pseudomonas TaxID=196821 RepID=UPI00158B536B|nr:MULTISPECIES: hypothetical protein [unclassified Pseudomonas]HEN8799680.1 hypothetical protein [Pseudomonas putida]
MQKTASVFDRLTDQVVQRREVYYLVVPQGRTVTPTILGLVDWLRDASPAG